MSVEGSVLVIGYGNPLRSDAEPGGGPPSSWQLTEGGRTDVMACHQLTPELAEDVSRAGLVVLVDASTDQAAEGVVCTRPLPARPGRRRFDSPRRSRLACSSLAAASFGEFRS